MKTKSMNTLGIKDGTYKGKWGGYVVEFVNEADYEGFYFTTKDGVRGFDIPVTIEVKDGHAIVTVNEEN